MDPHASEALAAIEGMQDTYGVVPTVPVMHVVGTKPVPVWNVGAVVTWTDHGRHRHGNVVDIRYDGEDQGPDRRIYVIQTRDPVSLRRQHVELTHSQLCEW